MMERSEGCEEVVDGAGAEVEAEEGVEEKADRMEEEAEAAAVPDVVMGDAEEGGDEWQLVPVVDQQEEHLVLLEQEVVVLEDLDMLLLLFQLLVYPLSL